MPTFEIRLWLTAPIQHTIVFESEASVHKPTLISSTKCHLPRGGGRGNLQMFGHWCAAGTLRTILAAFCYPILDQIFKRFLCYYLPEVSKNAVLPAVPIFKRYLPVNLV